MFSKTVSMLFTSSPLITPTRECLKGSSSDFWKLMKKSLLPLKKLTNSWLLNKCANTPLLPKKIPATPYVVTLKINWIFGRWSQMCLISIIKTNVKLTCYRPLKKIKGKCRKRIYWLLYYKNGLFIHIDK